MKCSEWTNMGCVNTPSASLDTPEEMVTKLDSESDDDTGDTGAGAGAASVTSGSGGNALVVLSQDDTDAAGEFAAGDSAPTKTRSCGAEPTTVSPTTVSPGRSTGYAAGGDADAESSPLGVSSSGASLVDACEAARGVPPGVASGTG